MQKIWILLTALLLTVCVSACGTSDRPPESEAVQTETNEIAGSFAQSDNESESTAHEKNDKTEYDTTMKMNVKIDNKTFTATLEDNAAVREFIEMMRQAPVSVDMSDYSGFEKVGSLGRSLTADDRQTTTDAGDIVLYNGNQIVMFYGSNSWSYTRIGHIDDLTGWENALGSGSITAVFTLAE